MVLRLSTLAASFLLWVILVSAKPEAPDRQPQKGNVPSQTGVAVIEDSGSTNTPGYRLSIDPSGEAEWTLFRRRNSPACSQNKGRLAAELAQELFAGLRRLTPLEKLASRPCMKSVSFGTTLRVRYEGSESADLSCAVRTPEVQTLLADLDKINTALGISLNIKNLPATCDPRGR